MEIEKEALRAIARALEAIRDALEALAPEDVGCSIVISDAVRRIGEAIRDGDGATAAGSLESDPE